MTENQDDVPDKTPTVQADGHAGGARRALLEVV